MFWFVIRARCSFRAGADGSRVPFTPIRRAPELRGSVGARDHPTTPTTPTIMLHQHSAREPVDLGGRSCERRPPTGGRSPVSVTSRIPGCLQNRVRAGSRSHSPPPRQPEQAPRTRAGSVRSAVRSVQTAPTRARCRATRATNPLPRRRPGIGKPAEGYRRRTPVARTGKP